MFTTVLITGANGFLGRNLMDLIKKKNYSDTYRFLTPSSSLLNLLDYNSVRQYFNEYDINSVVHLAAACGGIGLNATSPADLTHNNNKMTVNIFDAIRNYNIKYFIGLGTVCSYPDICPIPFKEEYIWEYGGKSQSTNHGYGESKKMLITEFQQHKIQYGLKGVMFVPANLMGKHDHFDLINSHVVPALINKFVNAVENNLPIVECWGTGEAGRDLLAAQDAAEAILQALLTSFDYPDPVNLGTNKEIKIKDLANLIAKLTGFAGKIIFNGDVSDGQKSRRVDPGKAKTLLNWEAQIDLETGLKETIEWYKANKKNLI